MLPHWKRRERPSPVDPARQDLGIYSDIATDPQPLGFSGPMAQGHLTLTETQDVYLIRSQVPKMNMHEVPSFCSLRVSNTTLSGVTKCISNIWEKSKIQAFNKPVRIHCKAGGVSARLVFETRPKCQDFVARFKDDGISYEVDCQFFANAGPTSQPASPSLLKSRK